MKDQGSNSKLTGVSRRKFFQRGLGVMGGLALGTALSGCRNDNLRKGSEAFRDAHEARRAKIFEVDPALVKYQEAERWDVAMANPRTLVLTGQDQLIVTGEEGLEAIPREGSEPVEVPAAGPTYAYLETPDGKHRFVADRQTIADFQPGQDAPVEWSNLAGDAYITDFATDGEYLYIADAGSRLFWKFEFNGRLVSKWGHEDESLGQKGLIVPSPYLAITVDHAGYVWGVNPGRHMVNRYAENGAITDTWGFASSQTEGFCGCCNPTNLVAFENEAGFVTCEKGIPRIKIYAPDGTMECVVAPPAEFEPGMESLSIAAKSRDEIFALDPFSRTVRRYVPKNSAA